VIGLPQSPVAKPKIAVLGGGMAAMAAVHELTRDPDWKNKYEIIVYQLGYRLGGKGASGRNIAQNARIEEHGPHAFWGFYENLFRILKETYDELERKGLSGQDNPFKTFYSAISPNGKFFSGTAESDGRFHPQKIHPPTNRTIPGQPVRVSGSTIFPFVANWLSFFLRTAFRSLSYPGGLGRLLDDVSVIAIIAKGLWKDRNTIRRGWEQLDDEDFRDWLRRHGAKGKLLESRLVRYPYFVILSYDTTIPAGTILKGMLSSLLYYRGAYAWKLNAGMGEIVFAPLYRLLQDRGVKFKFFHKVENLGILRLDDHCTIESIELVNQLPFQMEDYDPLINVNGIPCWPVEPRWEYLAAKGIWIPDHARQYDFESYDPGPFDEKIILRRGVHYDLVLLGISVGALPYICKELIADNPTFAKMVASADAVPITSAQLWFDASLKQLGWKNGSFCMYVGNGPYRDIPGHHLPDTYSDFSQITKMETWTVPPLHCCYLSGRSNDQLNPMQQVQYLLKNGLQEVIPGFYGPSGIRWNLLTDPFNRSGEPRLLAQYYTKSKSPSDFYVRSPAGTTKFRLSPGQSGYDNLVLTGDWVRTPLSLGCIESATMSGLQASVVLANKIYKTNIDEYSRLVGAFSRSNKFLFPK
jgi:uncharacterized protein with NAD-binding domain and iron-sulfur cluster